MRTADFPFELDTKTTSVNELVVAGYASTFGSVDRIGDTIHPDAFTRTLAHRGVKGVKVLWQHDQTRPIGRPVIMSVDSTGLYTKTQLSDTRTVREEYMPLLRDGVVDRMSIGYSVPPGGEKMNDETGSNTLLDVDLHEYSMVTFPANEHAVISSVKARSNAERAMRVEQLDTADDAKYAMAMLMGARGASSFSDLSLSDRRDLYARVKAAYDRHELRAPDFAERPVYAEVRFAHDEQTVFLARSLVKRLADVTSIARGLVRAGGTLPAGAARDAQRALVALSDPEGALDVTERLDRLQRARRAQDALGISITP